jgi:tRNA-Thr(GGU) m(6)t(6)A37 methyltransferase TsaA
MGGFTPLFQQEKTMNLEPIGYYRSSFKFRFETPRQSVFSQNSGVIELQSGRNFETALEDLEGFDRIWILFQFHLNQNWKPKVRPPVAPGKERIGVFATRSPHRPNSIGLSCVKLEKVEKLLVYVQDCDILDGSPVFDIKPYIPAADSFPDSRTGWLERVSPQEIFEVSFCSPALEKISFLKENGYDAENFCRIHLCREPLNPERKRLYEIPGGTEIGFRTWRIRFRIIERTVQVFDLRSNYTAEDLAEGAADPYSDKDLHRRFRILFP